MNTLCDFWLDKMKQNQIALLTSLIEEVGRLPQGEGILGALDSLTAKLKALDNNTNI